MVANSVDVENAELLKTLQSIGLSENKAKETLKNHAVTEHLLLAIKEASKSGPVLPTTGTLLYHLATKVKTQITSEIPRLVTYIVEGKLDSTLRLDAALEYLLTHVKSEFNKKLFEEACGIGKVVTPEEIEQCVERVIKNNKDQLLEKRYHFNVGIIMQDVRADLKWADGKAVKSEVDMQVLDLLGPKTEADKKPPAKPDKEKKPEGKKDKGRAEGAEDSSDNAGTIAELMKNKVHFHKVGENFKTDGYVVTPNTKQLLENHLKLTGGKVRTRFPPEPNGILHIGHAKAINISFGYAAAHDGLCFLRFDDTNPEKEEEKFFTGIEDIVRWLGYTPYQITHSSDYFQQLYEWAVLLISRGMAYVCHQKAEDMKGFNPPPSPWRDRSVQDSLKLFQDMKHGIFDEGEATLRMKVTLEEGKQDPVAYRIKYLAHHRTGSEWCIYPTYDYTHCLCDSIENITHSLCTKEFQSRRSSYYWLCNALDIYCPVQWEFGRLSVNYTVTSKRKIAKLISEGIVSDWDDPRLFTLTALRRRGFPAEAINNFCARMGVTGAMSAVDPQALEACVRDVLNITAPRSMVVLEPLKVVITNFPHQSGITLSVPDFPTDPSLGCHQVQLDSVLYIEQSDFRENPEPGYRRLTPGQSVGLRHAGLVLSVLEVLRDESGAPREVLVTCASSEGAAKPKAFIHWVSRPVSVSVRIYNRLFLHKNPDDSNEVPHGFLSDCNPDSLREVNALGDTSLLLRNKELQSFQFERVGFFTVDKDTRPEQMVFNQTVTLKEDVGKE